MNKRDFYRFLKRDSKNNRDKYVAAADAIKKEAKINVHRARRTTFSGVAMPGRVISTPPIRDIYSLYILAHECGHVILRHNVERNLLSKAEYEAGKWAIAAMRRHGVVVPRCVLMLNRHNVQRWVEHDEKHRKYGIVPHPPAVRLTRLMN